MADDKPVSDLIIKLIPTADYKEIYANNVRFEASLWDLKILFGILDQSVTPQVVRHHASVNVPWAQVKLMAHFLKLNILIHEHTNGKVHLPAALIPQPLGNFLKDLENEPGGKELLEKDRQGREDLT